VIRWRGGFLAALFLATVQHAAAATYTVTSIQDHGPGTLRWAITESNSHPGPNQIKIAPSAKAIVIRLETLLPPIKGPVTVQGFTRSSREGAAVPGVTLDGGAFIDGDDQKSCPGEGGRGSGPNVRSLFGAGLAVVDSADVRISNFELRDFCIGIMVLRSHDVRIDHNFIHDTAGAAGVLVTGDDGGAQGGSTVGLATDIVVEYNIIHDTGDGAECTRGVTNALYRFNTMWESRTRPNVPYSQGVECAGSGDDRIRFIGNSIAGYSDGLQLNGATNLLVAGNRISGTTYGITAAGSGLFADNVLTGNRMAVGLSEGSHISLRQNSIFDNGRAGILSMAGSAGGTTDPASPNLGGVLYLTRRNAPPADGTAAPASTQSAPPPAPVLAATSHWEKSPVLMGNLTGAPNAHYRVELFASHAADAASKSEGEVFVGSLDLVTDSQGKGNFSFAGPANPLSDNGSRAYFTATATGPDNATSSFSEPLVLTAAGAEAAQ